jgi:hypothetical protein
VGVGEGVTEGPEAAADAEALWPLALAEEEAADELAAADPAGTIDIPTTTCAAAALTRDNPTNIDFIMMIL